MGKLGLQKLVATLVEKHGLQKEEAQQFVSAVFECVQDGLRRDKLVKVKGLGTFKVVDVSDRESIDVTTGARVLIEGHPKITFTPDSAMRELVNKPFSGFDTVILKEGVTFDDDSMSAVSSNVETAVVEELTKEKTVAVEEPLAVEEPVVEEAPVAVEQPVVVEEQPVAEEEPVVVEEQPVAEEVSVVVDSPAYVVEPIVEQQETDAVESNPAVSGQPVEAEDDADEEAQSGKKNKPKDHKKMWVLLCLLCFGVGFLAGYGTSFVVGPMRVIYEDASFLKKNNSVVELTEEAEDSVDSVVARLVENTKKGNDSTTVSKTPAEQPVEAGQPDAEKVDYRKYEAMDIRIKTGAYRIVGVDHEVKVKPGETLGKISLSYFGPGMECYLEAFNGIKSSTAVLPAGTVVKIPKLEMKKRK